MKSADHMYGLREPLGFGCAGGRGGIASENCERKSLCFGASASAGGVEYCRAFRGRPCTLRSCIHRIEGRGVGLGAAHCKSARGSSRVTILRLMFVAGVVEEFPFSWPGVSTSGNKSQRWTWRKDPCLA